MSDDATTAAGRDRLRQLGGATYDVIVVGAGIGGLVAAALLARRGKRVLVVEQHHVAGGCATVFRRGPYTFDVGLHYIGACGERGSIPKILRAAGVDDVRFIELDPDGSDVFVFPDFTLPVPRDRARFRQRLLERFPNERRGVDRFLRLLRQVDRLGDMQSRPWTAPIVLPRAATALRYLKRPLAPFLASCTDDAQLRAVLSGWQVICALPPSRVSTIAHAGVVMHYTGGTYYPAGGGQVLSDRLAAAIEAAGSELLLGARVQRVLIEDRRVRGVVLVSKHLGERTVHAEAVISDADLPRTLLELVGPEHLEDETRARLARFSWPAALSLVCLGVQRAAIPPTITSGTYTIFPSYDVEPCYAEVARGELPAAPYVCVTVPTIKDPDNPRLAPPAAHNVQLMAVAPAQPEAWGVTEAQAADGSYRRVAAYRERKARYARRLIEITERMLLPGLRDAILFEEAATPLTHRRYTGAPQGTGYGIALTPSQTLKGRPAPATEIAGLYLAGASARTMHGIYGVMKSGVAAAAELLGPGLQREIFGR